MRRFGRVRLRPRERTCATAASRDTQIDRRDEPETPVYDRIANTAPRWRDLVGYYTRFGDVARTARRGWTIAT